MKDKKISETAMDLLLKVQELEEENEALKNQASSKKLICPYCKDELDPINYHGYYEKFACWICDCDEFKEVRRVKGQYA